MGTMGTMARARIYAAAVQTWKVSNFGEWTVGRSDCRKDVWTDRYSVDQVGVNKAQVPRLCRQSVSSVH